MDKKIAHLGFIQGVINRMGSNSFMIKGWCISLIVVILALSNDTYKINLSVIFLVAFPLIIFWWLDTFFLRQEKMYRKLYEDVANGDVSSDKFTMDASGYSQNIDCYLTVALSKTLFPFYGIIITITIIPLFSRYILDLFKC